MLNPTEELELTFGHGRAALDAAFEQVQNPNHWKDPIDRFGRWSEAERAVITDAIRFFTATEASWESQNDQPGAIWRVTADGYRAGPAGDH